MKVLKKGRGKWSARVTCTGDGNGGDGCGASLLVEEGDLMRTGSHHYDGSSEYYVSFYCPECGVMTDFDGHVPVNVKLKKGPGAD